MMNNVAGFLKVDRDPRCVLRVLFGKVKTFVSCFFTQCILFVVFQGTDN